MDKERPCIFNVCFYTRTDKGLRRVSCCGVFSKNISDTYAIQENGPKKKNMKFIHAAFAACLAMVVLSLANILSSEVNVEADEFRLTQRPVPPEAPHSTLGPHPTALCPTLGVDGYIYTHNHPQNISVDSRQGSNSSRAFQIHVITMKRAASLQRLLTSLEGANYDGDAVELYIHIDKSASNAACVEVAKAFSFSHGSVCFLAAETNMGLRNSWFNAWYPVEHQRAIILEDDIVVSTQWYLWMKAAWNAYGHRSDLAGLSLQRQVLVPQKPHKNMEIVNHHKPFLYKLVGSIGFSPHWKVWMAFLNWVQSVDLRTVDVEIRSLVTSDWHYRNNKRHMWTHYFIWFCEQHDLYTLYVNLPGAVTLGTHMREHGEHHQGNLGKDFQTATHVVLDFPDVLWKYGWDGTPLYSAMYNDASQKFMLAHTNMPTFRANAANQNRLQQNQTQQNLDNTAMRPGMAYDATDLDASSVVYSVGLGCDTSWEEHLMKQYGLRVWGFDPAPASISCVHTNTRLPLQQFHFTPEGLDVLEGNVVLQYRELLYQKASARRPLPRNGTTISVNVNTLRNWMRQFGHLRVDILRLDVASVAYEVLEDCIETQWFPMKQLLVKFEDAGRHARILAGFRRAGFSLLHNEPGAGLELSLVHACIRPESTQSNVSHEIAQTHHHENSARGSSGSTVSMAQAMNKEHGFVNVQFLNAAYISMTKSWICNVRVFPGVLEKTLFVATDAHTYSQLRSFDSTLHLALEAYNATRPLRYGQYAYYHFILFRTTLVLELLHHGIVVWITESDAVWWQDPTAMVMNTTGDMVAMNDDYEPTKSIQGGFLLLRPTRITLVLWKQLFDATHNIMRGAEKNSEMRSAGNEQIVLGNLVFNSPDVHLQWLDPTLFVSGLYYRKDQRLERIKNWFLGRKTDYHPIVILNNWIRGNAAKEERVKKWKHWFLSAQEQCIENI